MRPVNLIPLEERRGRSTDGSRHIAAYAVIGALALVLVAVVAITLFDNKAADSQAKLTSLQAEVDSAQAQASGFSSFTSFQQVHDERMVTIDSLAKSRFDWERIMRELSIVIPDNVFLVNLTGTVSPDASVTNAAGLSLRGSIPGPALELVGCAQNQRTVARLIAAMHDIDGVGRVLVSTSAKAAPTDTGSSASGTSGAAGAGGCGSRPTFPSFQLVAALDGVPTTAPVTTSSEAVPTSATPATGTTPTPATGTATTPPTGTATTPAAGTTTTPSAGTPTTTPTTDGGVAATSATSAQQQSDVAAAQQQANAAAQIPSGGGK